MFGFLKHFAPTKDNEAVRVHTPAPRPSTGRVKAIKTSLEHYPLGYISIAEKRCSKCGNSKPQSEFHNRKKSADGLQSRCKLCLKKSVDTV